MFSRFPNRGVQHKVISQTCKKKIEAVYFSMNYKEIDPVVFLYRSYD